MLISGGAVCMKFVDLETLRNFPIRPDRYDKANGSFDFVSGIETVIEYAEKMSIVFDMGMVLEQLEDYGRYKGVLHSDGDMCENYIPVSAAKKIVIGRGLGRVLGYMAEDKGQEKLVQYDLDEKSMKG